VGHLLFIPEENKVEYKEASRCFSSVQGPTSWCNHAIVGEAIFLVCHFDQFMFAIYSLN